jgi:peptidoglycan/LPS O-acetylase OafA/YrhL
MIRGIAALVVLVSHVRNLFFKDYHQLVGHKNYGIDLLYGSTALGHQAVVIFFVLSGYFVGGSVLSTLAEWSWSRYIAARLSRLYVVTLPALAMGFLVDQWGRSLTSGYIWYDRAIPHFNVEPFSHYISADIFVGNLFFLQTIVVPTFGTNGPLWSLANEFWYYALFPLLALTMSSGDDRRFRFLYLSLFTVLVVWLPNLLLWGFLVWLMGAFIHFVPKRPLKRSWLRAIIAAILPFLAWVLIRERTLSPALYDLLTGACFALGLCVLVKFSGVGESATQSGFIRKRLGPFTYTSVAHLLAGCSFSVYAIHFPCLMLLRSALGPDRWLPTPIRLVESIAIASFVFIVGLLFSRLTEVHTEVVRRRIKLWLTSKSQQMQPSPATTIGDGSVSKSS